MLAILLIFILFCGGRANTDIQTLVYARKVALQKYPKDVQEWNTLEAYLKFNVISITKVDAASQTFSCTGLFSFNWKDPNLDLKVATRNTSTDMNFLYYPKEIMSPIFMIKNGVGGSVFIQWNTDLPIKAEPNGHIYMSNIISMLTTCYMDVTYFPFDEQVCEIILVEYIGTFTIDITNTTSQVNGSTHSEWSLQSLTTHKTFNGNHVIRFELKRQSLFYVVLIIFPMSLLSVLNSFVFLLPSESGEKISFLVSIFVTYAVFVNFVNNLIPKTDQLPRVAIYLVLVQCHSTFCILATIYVLHRHHMQEKICHKPKDWPTENGTIDDSEDRNRALETEQSIKMTVINKFLSIRTIERIFFCVFFCGAFGVIFVFV